MHVFVSADDRQNTLICYLNRLRTTRLGSLFKDRSFGSSPSCLENRQTDRRDDSTVGSVPGGQGDQGKRRDKPALSSG